MVAELKSSINKRLGRLRSENQDCSEYLIQRNQSLVMLDNKIKALTENCAIKFPATSTYARMGMDAQNLEENIKMMMQRIGILQKIQLVQLKSVQNDAGKKLIELQYLDLIHQRFEFSENRLVTVAKSSLKLDFNKIELAYPFLNAKVAFETIVSILQNRIGIPFRNVPVALQRTSWLVGLVMDILQELRDCRKSFKALTRFLSDGGDFLYLTLLSSIMEMKVVIVFEMSCLRCGVYPRSIMPRDVDVQHTGRCSESYLTAQRVKSSISNVEPGFERIKRICACVYNLMGPKCL